MKPVEGRWGLFIFCFLAPSAVVLSAQPSASDGSGSLSGRIVDSRGGVIHQVTVTLRDQETGFERSLNTDLLGTFQFEVTLPPKTSPSRMLGFRF